MNKIWSDEVEGITFIPPFWKSLYILPSLLDLLINDTVFMHSNQLVRDMPTQRPFIVMVWFHFCLLCKENVISEPTIQALLKSINSKTLSQYSGIWKRFYNWFNISENSCEINRSLICDFLSDMYNKGYTSNYLKKKRSALK